MYLRDFEFNNDTCVIYMFFGSNDTCIKFSLMLTLTQLKACDLQFMEKTLSHKRMNSPLKSRKIRDETMLQSAKQV